MAVNELWYDALGQTGRVGVERSLVGLIQDLLKSGGYVWSDCHGVWSCYESGEDGSGTHLGVQEGV